MAVEVILQIYETEMLMILILNFFNYMILIKLISILPQYVPDLDYIIKVQSLWMGNINIFCPYGLNSTFNVTNFSSAK